MIAIIDYDIGNLGAIANMLVRLGAKAKITSDPDDVRSAVGLILPGNGSFDACMRGLRSTGLLPVIEKSVFDTKVPLLGICVGAQMLGTGSEEGGQSGLGWIDTIARKFPVSASRRVPHMGWCGISVTQPANPIGSAIEPDSRFYFVHSYFLEPRSDSNVFLKANYGLDFAAGVVKDNVYGVQFHPEKSHRYGKNLLRAFKDLCG
jgi:glutamine amidotransferase